MSDLDDLILLQRAIAAGRFMSDVRELFGSPRMAEIHHQVYNAIVQAKGEVDAKRPDGWTAWRQLANNPEHAKLVVEHASTARLFHDWSRYEQVSYLRVCIAPFVASDDEVDDLLEQCRSVPVDGP